MDGFCVLSVSRVKRESCKFSSSIQYDVFARSMTLRALKINFVWGWGRGAVDANVSMYGCRVFVTVGSSCALDVGASCPENEASAIESLKIDQANVADTRATTASRAANCVNVGNNSGGRRRLAS